MPRTDPFANIPKDKENDVQFLLRRAFDGICAEMDVNFGAVKGAIGNHNGRLEKLEGKVGGMEACPCGKRHDPTIKCPLFILENEVLRTKSRNGGIYAGLFISGAIFYHLTQLLFAYLKIAG